MTRFVAGKTILDQVRLSQRTECGFEELDSAKTHPNFFGSSQAGVIDPKKKYSVHFSRVGVKIELDRDSLDERPLWSTLDPTWCVFILTDGSAFETQPLRTFCGGSQEPLERKDVLP